MNRHCTTCAAHIASTNAACMSAQSAGFSCARESENTAVGAMSPTTRWCTATTTTATANGTQSW